MTICHQKHSHRPRSEPGVKHPFRSPDEEEDIAHIHVSWRLVLMMFGMIPVTTYLIAIWISAHPHFTEIDPRPNRTQYIKEHYRFNESGNGHIYVVEKDGRFSYFGVWFKEVYVYNMTHYTFGNGMPTFCYKREEPYEHDWSTSIFRASQLYSSVQTGLRYGVLITMVPMVLTAYIIAKTVYMEEEKSLVTALIGTAYVCNEVLLYLASFLLTTFHVWFDRKYIPYDTIYFSMVVVFVVLKLMLRNFTERVGITTFFRSLGVLIFTYSWDPLRNDVEEYAKHIWCDTFAPPKVCLLQLLCLLVIFLNNLYDVQQSKIYHVIVSSTLDDEKIRKIPKTSIFRRQHLLYRRHV